MSWTGWRRCPQPSSASWTVGTLVSSSFGSVEPYAAGASKSTRPHCIQLIALEDPQGEEDHRFLIGTNRPMNHLRALEGQLVQVRKTGGCGSSRYAAGSIRLGVRRASNLRAV